MYHVPVLLQEAVDGLNIDPHGVYLDLTFGAGRREVRVRESQFPLFAAFFALLRV